MLQGYPFKGTAGAATIYDPILGTTTPTLTIRGSKRQQHFLGVSVAGDTPTFLNNVRIKLGNSTPDYRYLEASTNGFDADNVLTQPGRLNFIDFGSLPVNELETMTVTLVGTGEFSGVLWFEDGEDTIAIPGGQIVMLKCGGTNDGTTSLATTGFDMDARKLENNNIYTPFMVDVGPEDKVIEQLILRAGKESMTLPPAGRMVYEFAPLEFSGVEYNDGKVIGKMQVQAATKADIRIYLIERPGPVPSVNGPPVHPAVPYGRLGAGPAGMISVGGSVGGSTSGRFSVNQFRR